jgi:hypothetical protein
MYGGICSAVLLITRLTDKPAQDSRDLTVDSCEGLRWEAPSSTARGKSGQDEWTGVRTNAKEAQKRRIDTHHTSRQLQHHGIGLAHREGRCEDPRDTENQNVSLMRQGNRPRCPALPSCHSLKGSRRCMTLPDLGPRDSSLRRRDGDVRSSLSEVLCRQRLLQPLSPWEASVMRLHRCIARGVGELAALLWWVSDRLVNCQPRNPTMK